MRKTNQVPNELENSTEEVEIVENSEQETGGYSRLKRLSYVAAGVGIVALYAYAISAGLEAREQWQQELTDKFGILLRLIPR